MKWMSVYLLGYLLFVGGVTLALWRWGLLENADPTWALVVVLLILGVGVRIAVRSSGRESNIEIDHV
jgi:FtsH-binding integral membrane protein